MTAEEFNGLPLQEQHLLVFKHGKYLRSTNYYGNVVSLYLLWGSYVEVYFNGSSSEVDEITVAEYRELHKYVGTVNLPS